MLSKIDRYLIACFVGPFLVVTAGIVGLYVVVDAVQYVDDYTGATDSVLEALKHLGIVYALSLPGLLAPLIPIATLVAAGFAVAGLGKQNELTALKASGISVHRALTGILVSGVVVAFLSIANYEYVVPRAERLMLPLKLKWTGRGDRFVRVGGYIEGEDTNYSAQFNVVSRKLRSVYTYQRLPSGDLQAVRAETGECVGVTPGSPPKARWLLRTVTIEPNVAGEPARHPKPYFWETRMTPDDFAFDQLDPSFRSLSMLLDLTRKNPSKQLYRVLLYSRMAYPAAGIVLLLIGVPVMLGHPTLQKSRVLAAGGCLIVSALFYGVNFVACNLGNSGNLPPVVAAWLPILLFGTLGLYLFDRVRT